MHIGYGTAAKLGRRTLATLVAFVVALGMSGCQDLGGSGPELRFFIQDSGNAPSSITTPVGFEGEIHMRVFVEIQDDVGFWNDVTGSYRDITLPLGDEDGRLELGRRLLAAGLYTRIRMVVANFEIHLTEAPSTFTMPPDGIVRIPATQEDPASFSRNASIMMVEDREFVGVTVDLNSGDWITTAEGGEVAPVQVSTSLSFEVN